jgi:UDP-N-acetylglucosamine acyltransferase
MIHPTAVIHPAAQLAANVTIGPYVVIEGAAVIGEGCVIHAHAIIGAHVVMGKGNTIGHGALIGGDPQDFAFKPEVRSRVVIGDGNRIREYVTIHRGTIDDSETAMGDQCFLMAGAHLAHNVRLGNHVILANNVLLGGHVHVGDRVFIGGGCVFHQHIRIGHHAICQGASAFSKDIPPFVIAAERNGVAGLNVIGLRRSGFDAAQRAEIKRAFDLLYRSGKNVTQAREAAAAERWSEAGQAFWEFVNGAKKKGLCDWLGSRVGAGGGEDES